MLEMCDQFRVLNGHKTREAILGEGYSPFINGEEPVPYTIQAKLSQKKK